jgi:hypothetical protein
MSEPSREVRVYDDGRRQVWREALAPGEAALFFADADTGHARNAFGRRLTDHWSRTCLVFPSRDAAAAFAERKVREVPSLACKIFASDSSEPTTVVADVSLRPERDPEWIRRRGLWGLFLISIGVVGVALEWYFEWAYILFAMIGVKFLTVGMIRFGEAINYHVGLKRRSDAAAR